MNTKPYVRYREGDYHRVELWFPLVNRWERCLLMDLAEANRVTRRHKTELKILKSIDDPVVARHHLVRYLASLVRILIVRTTR